MTETSTRSLAELQQVTQEYASYSQSRSGLGNVLGGAAGLGVFAVLWLIGSGPAAAVLTLGMTVAWLLGKELIRRRRYRPFGQARAVWPPAQRRRHGIVVCILTATLAVFAVLIVVQALRTTTAWSIAVPYLVFCCLTPWIAWRSLRTDTELLVGVFLLFASAVTTAGFVPDRALFSAILPLYSVLLIATGLKEDRQFRALAARLRARAAARV